MDVIPEYEDMLAFIEKNGGRMNMPPKTNELIDRLKLHNYAELYRSEETLIKMTLLAFMSADEINELGAELKKMPEDEQAQRAEELVRFMSESTDEFFDNIPDTPEKEQEAKKLFSELGPEEQARAIKQAQIAMLVFLASFHNAFSIMVHGRKMTDLVPAAESGDDEAFCLAVQVDKRLLSALPYFRERRERALTEGDRDFLDKLHYRETNPLIRSRIRYKTLWLAFALLDVSGHLDGSLKHREILDICEDAGVGGYKNRIEDVGHLSKRLREYREFQKTHQRSRH